ncbi:MAG: hypothetical protein OXK19_03820 [Candidatus Dadabacteria bacterium]|nr:hypothetical protein [Candidatus Dadabacteria bacterium]
MSRVCGRLLRVYILALALGLFPLYGCGGGGGGEGGSSRPSAGDVLDSVVSEADKNNAGDERVYDKFVGT